jgi:hypothetical protein
LRLFHFQVLLVRHGVDLGFRFRHNNGLFFFLRFVIDRHLDRLGGIGSRLMFGRRRLTLFRTPIVRTTTTTFFAFLAASRPRMAVKLPLAVPRGTGTASSVFGVAIVVVRGASVE